MYIWNFYKTTKFLGTLLLLTMCAHGAGYQVAYLSVKLPRVAIIDI